MEHREHSRMAMSEGPPRDASDPAATRRFARFVPAHNVRRLALSRIGLAILVSTGILAFVLLILSQGVHSAARWLHRQPLYALESITLDPPPPDWFRGGQERFVARIGLGKGHGEAKSVLDLELKQVAQEFRHHPWVKKVKRVRRAYPNRLTVELQYREPVARILLQIDSKLTQVVIDEDAVFLAPEDIDPSFVDTLIRMPCVGVTPADRTPGKIWSKYDGSEGVATPDEDVIAAANLAAFLKAAKTREKSLPTALRIALVSPKLKGDERGLFAQTSTGLWICWGDRPGLETPGTITAEAKWAKLCEWGRKDLPTEVPKNYYLEFTKDGVKQTPVKSGP